MSDDTPIGGFEITVTHLRRWVVVDKDAADPIVIHAEQMPDNTISIHEVVNGKADKGHSYTQRRAKMLKLLLEKVLEDV